MRNRWSKIRFSENTFKGVALFALVFLPACSLSSGTPRIRVSMPAQNGQMGLGFGSGLLSAGAPPPHPAAYSGFHCFGLNVTGPGVPPAAWCAHDPMAGTFGGLAPFSGGSVSVRVPSGPSRKVQLVGCPAIGLALTWRRLIEVVVKVLELPVRRKDSGCFRR